MVYTSFMSDIRISPVCVNVLYIAIWFYACLYLYNSSLQPVLDFITYIGCSISLLCLLASIIFFLSLR